MMFRPWISPVTLLALFIGMAPSAQAVTSRAGNAQDFGVGFAMGQPMGVTGKYWLSSTTAVDGFAGYHFNSNFDVHADYLLHTFSSFDVTNGRLPFYAGLGARINLGNSSDLGMRIPFGVSYLMPTNPVEAYVEMAPVVKLAAHFGFDIDGQIGVRVYLNYLK